jgi:hypothetical protein
MKKIMLFTAIMLIPALLSAYVEGSQQQIAKKWADPDQAPCVMFDPETGAALGYIKYANLDGLDGDEIIIPYRIRIKQEDREAKASAYTQTLSIDVVKNGKKIRGFIEIDLAYSRSPKPYLTVAEMFPGEAPKIFLMIYDGVDKEKLDQADKRCTILWNGLDQADQKREKQAFETAKMPWRFILHKFSASTPTLTEFYSKTEESTGKFYIHTLMKDAAWPQIPMKEIKAFEEEVRKYQEHIFWEYESSYSK